MRFVYPEDVQNPTADDTTRAITFDNGKCKTSQRMQVYERLSARSLRKSGLVVIFILLRNFIAKKDVGYI
jgi:hypothetical protein